MKYQLELTRPFNKKLVKLIQKGRIKKNKIENLFRLLESTPNHKSLKTHKVNSKRYGVAWSSRFDADIRVIWNFDSEDKIIILLLDIGGHSGGASVY